jgi:hypothetical protein
VTDTDLIRDFAQAIAEEDDSAVWDLAPVILAALRDTREELDRERTVAADVLAERDAMLTDDNESWRSRYFTSEADLVKAREAMRADAEVLEILGAWFLDAKRRYGEADGGT